jgi:hypothetical protein
MECITIVEAVRYIPILVSIDSDLSKNDESIMFFTFRKSNFSFGLILLPRVIGSVWICTPAKVLETLLDLHPSEKIIMEENLTPKSHLGSYFDVNSLPPIGEN